MYPLLYCSWRVLAVPVWTLTRSVLHSHQCRCMLHLWCVCMQEVDKHVAFGCMPHVPTLAVVQCCQLIVQHALTQLWHIHNVAILIIKEDHILKGHTALLLYPVRRVDCSGSSIGLGIPSTLPWTHPPKHIHMPNVPTNAQVRNPPKSLLVEMAHFVGWVDLAVLKPFLYVQDLL